MTVAVHALANAKIVPPFPIATRNIHLVPFVYRYDVKY